MPRWRCSFVTVGLLVGCLFGGCGAPPSELTREQMEKQRAEDRVDLDAESKAEAEFQKKLRKQK